MDLRTKLVFALVGATLAAMLALGTAGYSQAGTLLREAALGQLDALAESRRDDLESATRGWSERAQLIGSRTQLRLSLAAWAGSGDPAERERIERILEDARESVESVRFLAVLDTSGRLVASTGQFPGPLPSPDPETGGGSSDTGVPRLVGLTLDPRRGPEIAYRLELRAEGRPVGWLVARFDGEELVSIARDYTGLGETGETLIVQAEGDSARVLHPTRHANLQTGAYLAAAQGNPARLAASERDTVVWRGVTDYRGESVWAATRFLPGPGWGVVVKVDASEERRPILDLRGRMIRLALSLAAFAILAGIVLGLHLSRPLHELADVANRIRRGEMDARAPVRAEDEVGMLARTFNRMADVLTARHLSLAEERPPPPPETEPPNAAVTAPDRPSAALSDPDAADPPARR